MLAGGRRYFDELCSAVTNRVETGYHVEELLAALLEVTFASHRVLLAMGGAKQIPEQIRVPRPGSNGTSSGTQRSVSVADFRALLERRGLVSG
jgi:hypothetical protein